MLYEENRKNQKLDTALFKYPTAEYRGTPFWAWNSRLEKDELLRQIDVFKEMGLGGYHMHVRTGLETPYLSDEYMDLIKACVDHGKENGMLSWLYDEDRWPSGAAGGLVTKDHAYRERHIVFTADPAYKGNDETVLIARFDVLLGEDKTLKYYRILNDGEDAKGTVWSVYREIATDNSWYNNQAYVDTLNKKAIERFIEVTHDRYAEVLSDDFGGAIPAIFTDEPQFSHKRTLPFADSRVNVSLPWTDDIEETFKAAYGESLIEHLPELLWDLPGGTPSLTRYRYHDHIAERFASAFADTCGNWCDKHGILLTGHMMQEPTLKSQTAALGETMRSYRSFGLPGIDMLCARFEFTTAKQAQSAVHQYGRPGMLSELYGVTGWDFDFRGHKLHGDWQAALGVTVRVQHLSWVSMKGNAKRDYPASISYQSSWYSEYSFVEDHFARVNTALTRGTPLVKVGVIHPVESYWLHWGPEEQTALTRSRLDNNFLSLTSWLCKGSVDFDFISESLFPSLCEKASAPIRVGEMSYDVIIVPECETLRSTTLERLEAFKACGGKLIFMGDAPKYENAVSSERGRALFEISDRISFSEGALLSALAPHRTIEIRNRSGELSSNLVHQIRRDLDGEWLFIAHASEPYNKDVARAQEIKVTFYGERVPSLWDTHTGEVKEIPFTVKNGKTTVTLTLYDYDSALLFFSDKVSENSGVNAALPTQQREIKGTPFEVFYKLTEPNVLLLDTARYSLDGGEMRDFENVLRLDSIIRREAGLPLNVGHVAQPWVINDTSFSHTVTLEFEIDSSIDVKDPVLALEDADKAEIYLNGKRVIYSDLGYYTDKSIRKTALPALKVGKNLLRVTLPYGERSSVEALYLLGDFGVSLIGRRAVIIPLPEKLCFDDITRQGLPFYGGAIDYIIPLETNAAELLVCTPHYRAAVLRAYADGEKKDIIAYPPYIASLGNLESGSHEVVLRAYISRHNCFGHIHNADAYLSWIGPDCWRSSGSSWTYEYRLLPEGIISTPIFYEKD